MELIEFLLARIAEDEAMARDAGADAMVGSRWKRYPAEAYDELQALVLAHSRRVVAECEAKRRIVEPWAVAWADSGYNPRTDADGWRYGDHGEAYGAGAVLRLLALPYASHPDYQQEWRP